MDIMTAQSMFDEIVDACNDLDIVGTHDADVSRLAYIGDWFLEVPVGNGGLILFAHLHYSANAATFSIDVRRNDEPVDDLGRDETARPTAATCTGMIVRAMALVNLGGSLPKRSNP